MPKNQVKNKTKQNKNLLSSGASEGRCRLEATLLPLSCYEDMAAFSCAYIPFEGKGGKKNP